MGSWGWTLMARQSRGSVNILGRGKADSEILKFNLQKDFIEGLTQTYHLTRQLQC